MRDIIRRLTDWVMQNAVVLVSLLAYFCSMWDFLIGRNYFSLDFYHLHLTFEHAFKSLDNNFSIPTWIPFFQGGKASFGDMANSYSPFGIDFIFTYIFSKLFLLDKSIGLVLINTWRMVLLNMVFAFGCWRFSREILRFRYSADFVFLVSLFTGEFFLSHRPIFVMCNIFSPWVLLYITRIAKNGRERLLHNMAGFTLTAAAGIFHQYNIQSTLIWPYIFFYIIGLCIFGFGGSFLEVLYYLRKTSWKVRFGQAVILVTIIISTLPLIWEFMYFSEFNKKMIYPGQPIDIVKKDSVYAIEDFIYERFEWQKLLSLFFPYPSTLERVTNVKDGMHGHFVHNFQYFGILTALFIIIGIIFSRNRFKLPIFFGVIFYLLFFTVDRSPVFSIFFKLRYPMTRHFLFGILHLTPLLTVLGGMGMDRLLGFGRVRKWRLIDRWIVAIFCLLLIVGIFLSYGIIQGRDIVKVEKGYLYSILFIALSLFAIFIFIILPKTNLTNYIFLSVTLLDLVTFNKIGQNFIIDSGRSDFSHVYHHDVSYDSTLDELSLLDNYAQFTSLRPDAYSVWRYPEFYSPVLFRYAIIGNKSFYDVMLNTTPKVREMISGYLLPRLFVVEKAVEDPSGDETRNILSSGLAERIVDHIIFLNDTVSAGRESLISAGDLPILASDPKIDITEEVIFHNIQPSMVSTNIPIGREVISNMFTGDANLLQESMIDLGLDKDWWIQIDFGYGNEKVINFVKTQHERPFNRRIVFLDGSHDGMNWKRVGFLTYNNGLSPPWHMINEDGFRSYRVFIRYGVVPLGVSDLPQLQLGYEGRRVVSGFVDRFSAKVPLLRFTNNGLTSDKRYYIFSYYLPRAIGLDLTTEPAQRFGHRYSLTWADESVNLRPTWDNEWHSDNLFQLNYKIDGCLSINIPKDSAIKFRKKILEVDIKSTDTGVRVLDYSAGGIKVLVNRANPGWLYYADTWDKYWRAWINGKSVSLHKANLQFKAVFIPAGRQVIEIEHRPVSFLRIIGLSYVLQFIALIIWFRT